VADELGTAELKIVVDDQAARDSLKVLRETVEATTRQVASASQASALRTTEIRRQLDLTRQLARATKEVQPPTQRGPILGGGFDVAAQRVQAERRIAATRELGYESALRFERLLRAATLRRAQGERAQQALARRAGGAVSSGLIGGGFPLLFGQGAGAAAGGAIGGVAGGALGGGFGFALSVVGTAIGVAFDEALKKGEALAAGLKDPIAQFGALRDASLLSSKALESQIDSLIKTGREAEAAALIRLDLAKKFGDTSDFEALGSARDELSRAFTSLGVTLARVAGGPLTDFINKLATTLSVPAAKAEVDRRLDEAGASGGERRELLARARANLGEQLNGLVGSARLLLIYSEANALLDERVGKLRGVTEAEEQLSRATERRVESEALTLKIINAEAAGYARSALQLRRQQVEVQKLQSLAASDPGDTALRESIDTKALQETARINAQILALDRDRLATGVQQVAQFGIGLNALDRQLAAAQRLSQIRTPGGVSILRENATLIEGLLESVSATVDRQLEIESRIQAAQIRGGEQGGLDITQLAREQVVAATETRNALFEAASRLTDAGRKLRDDLRSAVLEFTSVRSDPQGLNRFLSPEAQGRRAQQDFERLLPQFRQAQARFFQLTGERAREFSGPTSGVNEALRDFINTVDREFNATETLNQTTSALNDTNTQLTTANLRLAEATAALAAKDWNVAVNVQGGSAQAIGDVVGALS
jgi:hypothetical protein